MLYANDPKQRLEVWWSNPAARTGTYLIVIGDKSTWTAPGGMKLGLTLAQLEKLNHKPFKLKGFDKNGVATVSDWDDGTLANLPSDCKSGLSLTADPKAAPDAISAITADQGIQFRRSRRARGQADGQRSADRLLARPAKIYQLQPLFG